VYTARFTDYLISAVMLFHEQMFEEPPDQFCRRYGIDYPCKALAMTFHRALWPDETFDMHVAVGEIRDSRYDVNVNASLPDGTAVFSGIVSPVCISRGERRAIAIPEVMLLRLHASKVQI
jgi:acyl-CoA thioester hydrolase